MRRSVWGAVMITALVLSAAGIFADGRNRTVLANAAGAIVSDIARSDIFLTLTSVDVIPWVGALAGLLVLTLIVRRLSRRGSLRGRRRRARRGRVLARPGDPISGIARRHGMAQDAVRTMMRAQMAPERRPVEGGNSFRSNPPSFDSMLRTRMDTHPITHYENKR